MRFRFSIRALLILTAAASIICLIGLWSLRAENQRSARVWLSTNGYCQFKYDYDPRADKHTIPYVPEAFVTLIGPDFFNLSELREINVGIGLGSNIDFSPLVDLPKLERITLGYGTREVTPRFDEKVREIRRLLPNVELVTDIDGWIELPDGACHFIGITCPPFDPSRLHNLVSSINQTKEPFEIQLGEIPDRYLSELKGAKNIRRIHIAGSELGNRGLVSLAKVSSLKEVEIELCFDLNHEGVLELQALRPDLNIYGSWMDLSNPNIPETVSVSKDGTETRFKHPIDSNNDG